MAKECFIPRDFRSGTRAIIRKANTLIDDYQAQGYKLTLRQLFYQFVSRNWIVNQQSEYKRLGEILNDARLAGLVDWDAIEDRGRNLVPTAMWGYPGEPTSPADFIYDWGRHFKNDPWENQPAYVEAWEEKDSLIGIVERPCRKWRVPFFSCRGYVSASEMYDAAQRLTQRAEAGQRVIVLHLGDHDPSGTQMTDNIEERLMLLSRECEGIEVRRIALNLDQIRAYNPPENTAKESDSRYRAYCNRYGTTKSWELDSMPPQALADLLDREIESEIDLELWARDMEAEREPKRQLLDIGSRWNAYGSNFHADLIEGLDLLEDKRREAEDEG